MKTNVLRAIVTLAKAKNNKIMEIYRSNTRINNVGDALEYYIKDLFCGTLTSDIRNKEKAYGNNFSYLGNQNNPPDFIIQGGDGVEVKKLGGISSIALNSSYPKEKLVKADPMITEACRDCEDWEEKDYIYVVGTVINKKVRLLSMVYGDCYAAEKNTYEKIRKVIKNGVGGIQGVQFSETKELGKVKKVDPLGITVLRVRGMWHIENPIKVFDYVLNYDRNKEFTMYAIMKETKYASLPEVDRKQIESNKLNNLSVSNIEIKNPNNPAKYIKAKLITVSF